MDTGNIVLSLIMLWGFWFFGGGAWAITRLVWGIVSKDDGRWNGFVLFFWWAVFNAAISGWAFFKFGNF